MWWSCGCSSEGAFPLHRHQQGMLLVHTDTPIDRHYWVATTFLATLTCTVVPSRLCSVSMRTKSKDRLYANQWVELSGGMTCLYKLMAPRAAPEHVMVPTNVFSHRLNSLSLLLPHSFSVTLSHSPQGILYHRQYNPCFFKSCVVVPNPILCESF